MCSGPATNSDDLIVYGPNLDDSRTTAGLRSGQDIKILNKLRQFDGRVVRVINDKIIVIVRRFNTSGKFSKPYRAHISAVKSGDDTGPTK